MTEPASVDSRLSEVELDELEALLASDVVPDDCMSLEMLDGYLAAVVISPEPLASAKWLPSVWSEGGEMAPGSGVQRVLTLVLRYHDELVDTLGDPEGWEPFCYAGDTEEGGTRLGDEWMTGFELGLEVWPEDWREQLDALDAETFESLIERAAAPWMSDAAESADDAQRIEWLTATGAAVRAIHHLRESCDLPAVPYAL
ncbi:MAG: YecA family protein [Rhodocyclaceae bacterium]|nr:YecA family protein [Rhodocyclaceae bacterium]